ncbi:MAG: UPF0280 family protein [Candidatus Omnitrophota bacterium]
MKTSKYQRRFYRDWVAEKDLYSLRIQDRESDLFILCDRPIDQGFIKDRLRSYRFDIERYIDKDRRFLTSLKPVPVELAAPEIVREMADAAKKANVGPMAAVAGAIAEFLGRDLLKNSCRQVIIENGGDIFLKSTKVRNIGIYSGKSRLWKGLCLKIRPKDTPLGICTSSGTIGHSLSFGQADSAVLLCRKASLADAVATAVCNRICGKKDLQEAIEFAKKVKGVVGIILIFKNTLASWGKIEFSRR